MRNRLLIIGSMCVLLLSVLSCRSERTGVISMIPEDRKTIIENPVSTTLVSEENDSDFISPVTNVADSAEKEAPAASAVSETPQVNNSDESRTVGPESFIIEELPKKSEAITPQEDDDPRQEDTVQSEAVQQEPEAPAESPEQTESTEPPAPAEPPTEPQPMSAYDYPFDISVIRSDCIAIGESMGYTLNASLTPQNATWWNPVTASKPVRVIRFGQPWSSISDFIRSATSAHTDWMKSRSSISAVKRTVMCIPSISYSHKVSSNG